MKPVVTIGVLILASVLLAFSAPFATAGETVYRWKDEAGNQVNSDRPPPQGIDYEVISTSSSMVHSVDTPKNATPTAVPAGADQEGSPAPVTAVKTPVIEKDPELCARAKDNLTQLDSHARIRLRDDKGDVRYLTEDEKQAEKQKALDAIKAFCD